MLKERMDYLCQMKNITRKELVQGLITLPHLSNILSGRYAMAEDLYIQFSQRLQVPVSYLTGADDISQEITRQCDEILEKVILFHKPDHNFFMNLPEQNDSLLLEMVSNLAKSCYYQATEQTQLYHDLYHSYLKFYLSQYDETQIRELPIPLRKAIYFFYMQYYRGAHDYFTMSTYLSPLITLCQMEPELWIQLKKLEVECNLNMGNCDDAFNIQEELFYYIRKEHLMHHLSSLYMIKSSCYFKLNLLESALVNLGKAEEYTVYTKEGMAGYTLPIYNNRIQMLTLLGKYKEAKEAIETLEKCLLEQGRITPDMRNYLDTFLCEIYLATDNVKALTEMTQHMEKNHLTEDIENNLAFYNGCAAFKNEKWTISEERLLRCLPYFETQKHKVRLIQIYELLAKLSKYSGKYKKAVTYYEQVINLSI